MQEPAYYIQGLFVFPKMRYFHEKPTKYSTIYGEIYTCGHPVYYRCTLYKINRKGLAVIQQRFDPCSKMTWWSEIDPWLTDEIYLHPQFKKFFDTHSGYSKNGLYPTVTVRQVMYSLRMKPLKRHRWETTFDHKDI